MPLIVPRRARSSQGPATGVGSDAGAGVAAAPGGAATSPSPEGLLKAAAAAFSLSKMDTIFTFLCESWAPTIGTRVE